MRHEMKMFYCLVLAAFLTISCGNCRSVKNYLERAPWEHFGEHSENYSYDIRFYNTSKWLTTSVYAFSVYEATEIGFERLYRYINGSNSKGVALPAALPFTVQTYQSECVFCIRNFSLSFYIPSSYQRNPPAPTDPRLHIEKKREFLVYTKRINPYRKPIRFLYEANAFYNHLVSDSFTEINRQTVLFATYGQLYKPFQQESEVWLFPSETFYEYEQEQEEEFIEEEHEAA